MASKVATAAASAAAAQQRLAGFTVMVKDNIAVANERMTCGSSMLRSFVPTSDATVVSKCRSEGAEITGKTSLDEFGMGSYGAFSPIHGLTINPWRATDGLCVPGGSSGGSAVAVALGQARAALGTDTGGSVRLPASFCGVVGFKPSYGLLSRMGMTAYASSLDTVGVLASTVDDAATMVDAMAGHDPRDAASVQAPGSRLPLGSEYGDVEGMVVGLPRECFIEELSDDVAAAWTEAADALQASGATVRYISLPNLKNALPCYCVLAPAEASSNLARYTGMFYGERAGSAASHASYRRLFESSRQSGLGPEVTRRILTGTFTLTRASYESFYVQAQRVRRLIQADFASALQNGVDVVLMPVTSSDAPLITDALSPNADVLQQFATDVFTVGPSLAGLPAMAVPCRVSSRNMPIGLQLVANVCKAGAGGGYQGANASVYEYTYACAICRTVFSALPELEYVALPALRGTAASAVRANHLDELFHPATEIADASRPSGTGADDVVLWLASADALLDQLSVRKAVAEDYDDLMPIFDQQTEQLEQRFGKFYLFQLIESEDENSKSAVIEAGGKACGFINVTKTVDIQALNQLFDLSAYNGLRDEENRPAAVAINLFAIDAENDTQAIHMLPYVFEAFPDMQYCTISLPAEVPEFPLLQHFNRVIPHPRADPQQELYVLHKFALSLDVVVRPIQEGDIGDVEALVRPLPSGEAVVADVSRVLSTGVDPDGRRVHGHVVECMGGVAGVVVSRDAKADAMPIRAHFSIEEYILYSQYQTAEYINLHHFVLNQLFQRHTRFVLREVLRKLRKSCLFYRIYDTDPTNDASKSADLVAVPRPSMSTVLEQLLPVKPRPQPVYDAAYLHSNVPSERVRDLGTPFALAFTARKLLLEPKVSVNAKIVVVGPSPAAVACLEDLCYRAHLRFNNLTYVCEDGDFVGWDARGQASSHMLAADHTYTSSQLVKLGLNASVTVLRGRVAEINRDEKFVVLDDSDRVDYNVLMYTPDIQYISTLDPEQEHMAPHGVHSPSSHAAVEELCEEIKGVHIPEHNTILVYGASADAYSAAAAVLELGAAPQNIVFVKSPPAQADQDDIRGRIGHADVEHYLDQSLARLGVRVHQPCTLERFVANSVSELTGAVFRSDSGSTYEVQCQLCLNLPQRRIARRDFLPLCEASIVFNQRVVIDNNFRTNDPAILSAGPFARYSNKYFAGGCGQCIFRPEEVGRAAAAVICRDFDPLEPSQDLTGLELPTFTEPRVCFAVCPNNLQYLHAQVPQSAQHNLQLLKGHTATSRQVDVTELVTGGLIDRTSDNNNNDDDDDDGDDNDEEGDDSGGAGDGDDEDGDDEDDDGHGRGGGDKGPDGPIRFFALRLDEFNTICGVTCLCEAGVDLAPFVRLIGLHQHHLNSVVNRYNQGLIPDFYKFFKQPWAVALFHDRFHPFLRELSALVKDNPEIENSELEDLVAKLAKLNVKRMQAEDETEVEDVKAEEENVLHNLKSAISTTGIQKMIKDRLMDYLTFNAYHLPMYARPGAW
ncbi:hypothetical protein PTSG_09594 [Salpingoeca rosetta]|uniref:Glutamyl-tRNA(Gln) amidotransferase subunit A, mitochondrial n=1 Tax=Salpingoeca rosetta (strain ATCC 50818 / BSB-021) TaxID=946362 RepID=F2ULG1_SALR5|nr:uncharacterized protein PTSG_09594 [Salpingoeca rosetta]EGD77960.1 hypothetical protein PTSG_09594 [Salpingoeca rosetta]|eukprot:XP_004990023.1 hypothetical protein PTSG_09594 [Salpingoeca rosetta]